MPDRGASLHIKVERPSYAASVALPEATTCRCVIKWKISFKGRKGVTDITVGPEMIAAEPIRDTKFFGQAMDPSRISDLNQPSLFI
jgi:hypothetical protein